ncbi:MAG: class I SAM-dependent rRNA methyltransferase [Alphaproteobacteria bacterium]|nr:class I SAM-dependent rRNA methyltransferase [Alphaproteobacteria bacterium]
MPITPTGSFYSPPPPQAGEVIIVRLKKGKEAPIRAGFPWVYRGDALESSEWLLAPAGSLVRLEDHKGVFVGIATLSPNSTITCRILTLKQEAIDTKWFEARISAALARRDKLFAEPFYRLIHSEADFLPGLLVDRYGEVLVVQVGTAGMEALQPLWLAALEALLSPKAVVLKNDSGARKLEGLPLYVTLSPMGRGQGEGANPHPAPLPERERGLLVPLIENNITYLADLLQGQKTGWFFDQRDNRRMMAEMAGGKTFLDVYSHSGGFGLLAAKHGANVTLVDSSKLALDLAKEAAALNGVSVDILQGDAIRVMQQLAQDGRRYDIVCADPPAYVKSKKDIASGMKGYAKVAAHAAALTAPGGLLFVASCSHHASRGAFNNAVQEGVRKAGRSAEIVRQTGASADHPRHPQLPQSEYLKGLLLRLD